MGCERISVCRCNNEYSTHNEDLISDKDNLWENEFAL